VAHGVHVEAVLAEYFPAVQSVHDEAPLEAYLPAPQFEQVVNPSDPENLPASQSTQSS